MDSDFQHWYSGRSTGYAKYIRYSAAISPTKSAVKAVSSGSLGFDAGSKVLPDTTFYNAAISACEKGGQWQSAMNLSATISACEKSGRMLSGLDLGLDA